MDKSTTRGGETEYEGGERRGKENPECETRHGKAGEGEGGSIWLLYFDMLSPAPTGPGHGLAPSSRGSDQVVRRNFGRDLHMCMSSVCLDTLTGQWKRLHTFRCFIGLLCTPYSVLKCPT